jgi:hypothetical protein
VGSGKRRRWVERNRKGGRRLRRGGVRDERRGFAKSPANAFIENHIAGERVFTGETAHMPTDTMFFIANKNSLKHARTTFSTQFGRNENKALTPPDTKV